MTALDVLGYERPSRLRPRSAGLVGLVVPDLETPTVPLYAKVIETALSRQGYTPVLCAQSSEGASEDEYVGMLLDRGVAGIIFVGGMHADPALGHDRYHDLVRQRLPMVLVNGSIPDIELPMIACDDHVAGELAVGHLTGLGHRRIGFIAGLHRLTPVRRQLHGFLAASNAQGVDVSGEVVESSLPEAESGYAGAVQLLRKGVTALVCSSDMTALGAIRAVRQRHLRVPEDVSVIGYGDSAMMGFTEPPLTTVRQPSLSMGAAAVRMLIDEIRGHGSPKGESLFLPELVIRSSTGTASALSAT